MRRGRTAAFLLLLTAGCASAAYVPWAPRVSSPSSAVPAGVPAAVPSFVTGTSNQAGGTASQRAAADARAILAWEKAHISASFSRQDVIIGPPSWNTVYSLPAVAGVLSTREMNVQFYESSGGSTVIMAAAMVAWEPSRPTAEVIPASVTEVTITPLGRWHGHPVRVTVTSAPVVRRLAGLVNQLPLSTAGDAPCAMGADRISLTSGCHGGPPVAYAAPGACGALNLRLGGKDEPALQPPGSFPATVLKLAGLNWQPVR